MAEKKNPVRSLIETGRRSGKLTNTEIGDAMEESGQVLDVEQMEKLYEELENNGIEVVDDDTVTDTEAGALTDGGADELEDGLSADGVAIDDPGCTRKKKYGKYCADSVHNCHLNIFTSSLSGTFLSRRVFLTPESVLSTTLPSTVKRFMSHVLKSSPDVMIDIGSTTDAFTGIITTPRVPAPDDTVSCRENSTNSRPSLSSTASTDST